MRPDLAQIILVPVEHRTSIVYATHDKREHGTVKRRRSPANSSSLRLCPPARRHQSSYSLTIHHSNIFLFRRFPSITSHPTPRKRAGSPATVGLAEALWQLRYKLRPIAAVHTP